MNTTIDGTGQNVTLDGNGNVEVLSVNSGVTLVLNSVTVANGNASDAGGGISVRSLDGECGESKQCFDYRHDDSSANRDGALLLK